MRALLGFGAMVATWPCSNYQATIARRVAARPVPPAWQREPDRRLAEAATHHDFIVQAGCGRERRLRRCYRRP